MSWIGGDLAGLQSMGTAMKGAPEATNPMVQALTANVDKTVGDAGWSGGAADSFRKAWTATSIQVGALATVVDGMGQTLSDLGDNLQKIEADLYNAAHDAQQKGAQIGADGKPLPLVITGNPDSQAAKDARQAQQDYADTYTAAIRLAKGFRLQAAKAIADIVKPIEPTGHDADFSWDKRVTLADYLRGLYAVPNERNSQWAEKLPDKLKSTEAALTKARADWNTAHDAYAAKGEPLPFDDPARLNHIEAVKDLKGLETKLVAAETGKGELPLSNALNAKLGDMDKFLPELEKLAPKSMNFLKQIPVVDVLASSVVAELQARDDIEKGQNPDSARAYDYGAAAIGLGAGAASVVGITAGATALGVTAPAWGLALAGGAVVVGVGDVAFEGFHEHWAEDIHDRGVWGGLKYGSANTLSNTGDDMKDLWKSASGATAKLWHKIF